jgi:FkbM family methyltransferase
MSIWNGQSPSTFRRYIIAQTFGKRKALLNFEVDMKRGKLIKDNFEEIEVELKQSKDGLYYRPESSDQQMLKDSNILNPRSDYFHVNPKDKVIMDCGANIGGFTNRAIKLGAKQVVAYEPEQHNFQMLIANTQELGDKVILNEAALIAADNLTISFWLNNSKRSSCSGNLKGSAKKKEFVVNALNFYVELEKYRPDLVKMDIEGGEYDILLDYEIPNFVKELVIEIHHPSVKTLKVANKLFQQLVDQFGEPPESHVKKFIVFGKSTLTVAHFKR